MNSVEKAGEKLRPFLGDFADLVAEAAAVYFEVCPEDFGVQYVGEAVVFGGTNRLIWTPAQGFRPDREYCSPAFLKHAGALGRVPMRSARTLEEHQ
jgi:hypothetical protein